MKNSSLGIKDEQANLIAAFRFLEQLVRLRLEQDLGKEDSTRELKSPGLNAQISSPFSEFIFNHRLNMEELVILLLALSPHVYPHFFDMLMAEYLPKGGEFPAFGGAKSGNHRGTVPTGETALYLLAGHDLNKRFRVQQLFSAEHLFHKQNVLRLEAVKSGEPPLSGRILLDPDYIDLFTIGHVPIPKMSSIFPALHISTELDWSDLVLAPQTREHIAELQNWVLHHETLLYSWGMHNKLKPGYRALFYGPPGAGKTLTATLLGKFTNKEVFKIDLSMVVSKFIGETEKNLASLFDKAQNKDWILFFDEADSIFGKRTNVRDAHDKYANQEVSYLLQRIELYPGLTILASNFKNNMDDAFLRRFNAVIYFPIPKPEERLILWQKTFPQAIELSENVNLKTLSQKYELTGSHIMNIVQYVCLEALGRKVNRIDQEDLLLGIRREMTKEGRSF